jgi:hypothetical protein
MESITRQVCELKPDERRVYEAALGKQLHENQQIILQVITLIEPLDVPDVDQSTSATHRPAWCNVYDGLTDQEIADVESSALHRDGWK